MQVSREVAEIINSVIVLAKERHYELVTPELLLYVICENQLFAEAFEDCGGSIHDLTAQLEGYFNEYMVAVHSEECTNQAPDQNPEFSAGMGSLLSYAWHSAQGSGRNVVGLMHLVHAMFELEESYAVYYMQLQGIEHAELLQQMTVLHEEAAAVRQTKDAYRDEEGHTAEAAASDALPEKVWQQFAVWLNDALDGVNPLIGREEELERTMQILCRKEKNNPLHIGEPGVGKTAITYGLARLIEEENVPEPLRDAKIFSLDLGSLIAGTQFRGDFEKRFKRVMDSISREEKPIVYIDEIHNIVGAGAVNGGAFDISNMLKPYLAAGNVRFIGATTYEEYKKHFEKSKSLVRRFQNIDIKEPDIEDATCILEGLKENYEKYHGVTYGKGVIAYAVNMSAKYVNERYLPDKAIDLIDEAGAYRRLHPLNQKKQSVGTDLIDEILSKTCQIPKQVVEQDEIETLATLEKRLTSRVFGQDEAVAQVVNAVKFSRAGLLEEGKPLASLLFVGPTGVGKTEIARSLADEMGIKLIRFDMSEYEEKHAVAKLIGSPAGYVGYEEGGLLTEEIRKNPHAVLLLDEIEKAHPDIYNILLQVMDYATLTDNQGRKADFRNVIVIMTSNAGASRIGKHGIGFTGQDVKSDVIMEEVKRIFQPEFRNRLNKIVVFHGMDSAMAAQITEKKLGELQKMLRLKKVELSVSAAAKKLLQQKGITTEFGAREIDRVIQSEVKPLLVDEILFGKLKKGGVCKLTTQEDCFHLEYPQDQPKKSIHPKKKKV